MEDAHDGHVPVGASGEHDDRGDIAETGGTDGVGHVGDAGSGWAVEEFEKLGGRVSGEKTASEWV